MPLTPGLRPLAGGPRPLACRARRLDRGPLPRRQHRPDPEPAPADGATGPAVMLPPNAATRSRIPASPLPVPPASPSEAGPGSSTLTTSESGSLQSSTTAACRAIECLITLVSASWTIRKAVRSTPADSARRRPVSCTSTSSPTRSACSVSSSSRSSPGAGPRGAAAPGARSVPSTWRTSPSASLLVALIVVSAVRACSGRLSISASATPAWMLISERLCARMSCNSRAIRSRSSLARR